MFTFLTERFDKTFCQNVLTESKGRHKHKYLNFFQSDFLNDIGFEISKDLILPNVDNLSIIPRQDTREKISEKITNYQEFTEKAQDKGLLKYLGNY